MIPFPNLRRRFLIGLAGSLTLFSNLSAVPRLLNHQGRIAANSVVFEGSGQFKFSLVNAAGTVTHWSNDGSGNAGAEPASAVPLAVTKGLYSVLLGDTSLPNMTAVPASVFENDDVRLRIWFNDGTHGFQLLSPDQRLAASPYALVASSAQEVLAGNVLAAPSRPVVAWGGNLNGQTTLPELQNVSMIAAGNSQTLVLFKGGTVAAYGSTSPAVPGGLGGGLSLAAGTDHALLCKTDGTITAWGANTYGQATVPGGITTARQVAAGEKHSLALLANGTVLAWGDNTFNQTTIPGAATSITSIACGYDHSLALKADGTVVAWGRDDSAQITVPPGLAGVVAIGAGAYHSLAVKSDGTVVAWGLDNGGQSTVPPGLSGVTKVAGGYAFSLALKTDGTVVAWGDNSKGQTTLPEAATKITHIAAGASHAAALRSSLVPAALARLDEDNFFRAKLGIGRAPLANPLEVEGNASKTIAGNWASNSDRRIKADIRPITNALAAIGKVRLVDFRYTDTYRAAHPGIADKRYLNVIAQEFAEVFPDHVHGSGEKLPDGSEILQVDTYPLTIYAAAAIQELQRENEALKKRLAEQEARLRRLEEAAATR